MLSQDERDSAIAKLYLDGVKLKDIEKILGVGNLPRIIKRLGLPNRRTLNRWSITEEERNQKNIQIAEAYRQGSSMKEIEKEFGFSNAGGNIARILRSQGIEPYKSALINWDTNFFDRRDVVAAYWAGFLFADGCIESKMNRLSLCSIHIQDHDHVCLFAKTIGAGASRVTIDSRDRVGIKVTGDQTMRQSLKYWGIVSRKTKEWVEPQITCPDLFKAFLVGLIDGDGAIRFGSDKRKNYGVSIASNHRALYEWLQILLRQFGYNGHFACYQNAVGFCQIAIAGKDNVFDFINFLKPWLVPSLERKWGYYSGIEFFTHG